MSETAARPDRARRRALWTSTIGSAVEWYDFYLYTTATALVIGPLFFPRDWALGGTVAAFATYAVGFVARPVGGVVAGHLGDRLGRKSMLVLSLATMGAATFLIGLLPTYAEIGFLAPAALVLLRLLQGIGVGAEWGGGVLVAVENAPPGRRGLFSSAPLIGFPLGLMLANATFTVLLLMPRDALLDYGWRIPFLASVVLVGVGVAARLGLDETPEFRSVRARGTIAPSPIREVLRSAPRQVVAGALTSLGVGSIVSYFTVYLVSLGPPGDAAASPALLGLVIGSFVQCLTVPLYASFCDRAPRRLAPTMVFGFVFAVVVAVPAVPAVRSGSMVAAVAVFVLAMAVAHSACYGNLATYLTGAFPVEHRYSAIAVTYQLGATVSSFLPLLLVLAGRAAPWLPPAALLAVTSGAAVVGVLLRRSPVPAAAAPPDLDAAPRSGATSSRQESP